MLIGTTTTAKGEKREIITVNGLDFFTGVELFKKQVIKKLPAADSEAILKSFETIAGDGCFKILVPSGAARTLHDYNIISKWAMFGKRGRMVKSSAFEKKAVKPTAKPTAKQGATKNNNKISAFAVELFGA